MSHTEQELPGRALPFGTHTPSTRQPSQVIVHVSVEISQNVPPAHWFTPGAQRASASTHTDEPLQATPSSQSSGVPLQEPRSHTSPVVQKRPSSHSPPSAL